MPQSKNIGSEQATPNHTEPKYMVRPDDGTVFERLPEGYYYIPDGPTNKNGDQLKGYPHWTYDLLTSYGFLPVRTIHDLTRINL